MIWLLVELLEIKFNDIYTAISMHKKKLFNVVCKMFAILFRPDTIDTIFILKYITGL